MWIAVFLAGTTTVSSIFDGAPLWIAVLCGMPAIIMYLMFRRWLAYLDNRLQPTPWTGPVAEDNEAFFRTGPDSESPVWCPPLRFRTATGQSMIADALPCHTSTVDTIHSWGCEIPSHNCTICERVLLAPYGYRSATNSEIEQKDFSGLVLKDTELFLVWQNKWRDYYNTKGELLCEDA